MERFRQLWNNITTQLGVLTLSQRLAIALCAALIVVSLLWLTQWSTTPEMTSLSARDFTMDELSAAEKALSANGIAHETHGTRLFVRAVDRHNALRLLHDADALPEGTLFDMSSIVNDANPFQSPEARQYAQNYAKGNELAKILATSPAVKQCSVIINPVTKRRLGGVTDVPTASVTVTLSPGREMTQSMVEGFAKLVAGSVAGLKPYNVFITDAGTLQSYSLPHPEDAASFDVLSMIKRREEHYRAKILSTLADIPGLRAAVTVELDMSKRMTQNVKHEAPQPKREMETTSDQSSGSAATEPGVQANLGQAVTGGSQGGSNTKEERTTENFEPKVTKTETIEQMPFAVSKITAAVKVPRSFITSVFKARQGDGSGPEPKDDDAAFVAFRDAEIARVKSSVERIVMAKNPDDVAVDVYPDMEWSAEGGVWNRAPGGVIRADAAADASDGMTMVRTYGPQVGLATLAMISLAMMMRIVRKSSEMTQARLRASVTREQFTDEEPILRVGSTAVGQAEPSEGLLSAREVDPASLHSQELGREVSKLVEQDPEGTAELIRRWIEEAS